MPEENFEQPVEPTSNGPQGPQASEPQAPQPINRPADGAKIASPDDVLGGALGGSQSAGDFLGLDTELTGYVAPASMELSTAPVSSTHTEHGASAQEAQARHLMGTPLVAPDGAPLEGNAAEAEGQAGAYAEEFEDGFEGEYAPEFDDEFEDEFEDDYAAPVAGGLSKLQMVGAFVGGLVVVLGVTAGPALMNQFNGTEPLEVAQVPSPTDATGVAPGQPAAVELPSDPASQPLAELAGGEPSTTLEPSVEPLVEPEVLDPLLSETLAEADVVPEFLQPEAFEPLSGGAEQLRPEVLGFGSDPLSSLSTDSGNQGSQGPANAGVKAGFPDFNSGYGWVNPGSLDMVWREETIPMEAIHAPARTMMPYVGMVRATLTNGASLDGKLHSLGEGNVWLRDVSNGGILGLDGNLVSNIERLAVEASVSLSQGDPTPSALATRVRVKLAGGTIAGSLVSREGDWVSIKTESGGVIRLKNPDMEEVKQERVILVRD